MFLGLALLAGPIDQYVSPWYLLGSPLPQFASLAAVSLVAGLALLVYEMVRRRGFPSRPTWYACLLLFLPQWCLAPFDSGTGLIPWIHPVSWGTALLISMAAPLWLGLAAALNVRGADVSRTVLGAAFVGIGAMCLVIPTGELSLTRSQLPSLAIHIVLALATAVSWVLACPRLQGSTMSSAAGVYLVLRGGGYVLFACVQGPRTFALQGWAAAPFVAEALALALSWLLWFGLLQEISLGAFAMRTLATCAAALLPGFFVYGFRQWRMDAALCIVCASLAVALRAHPADEQPASLGLANS